MFAKLQKARNVTPEKLNPLRRNDMEHEITSEMVCNFIRHKWENDWQHSVENLLEFSQLTEIDYSYLRKILKENAVWNITLPTINKLAAFMGVSTAKFFQHVEEFSKKMT